MGDEDFIDQVLTSLKVISMIKEGQKVRVRNGILDLETRSTGVYAAIRRWVNNDSRHNTILYIKNVVNNALTISKMGRQTTKLEDALTETIGGLSALSVTYGNDIGTVAIIGVLQSRIRTELEKDTLPLNSSIKNLTH